MIRRFIFTAVNLVMLLSASAQQYVIDSLKNELLLSKNDTTRMLLLGKIADAYSEINPDSAFHYGSSMLPLTKKMNLKLEEVFALCQIGYAQLNMGNYPRSLQSLLAAISISEDKNSEKNILTAAYPPLDEFEDRTLTADQQRLEKLSRTFHYTGILYVNSGNHERAKYYYYASIPLAQQINNYRLLSITYSTLGRSYLALKQPDSALICLHLAYENATKVHYNRYSGSTLLNIGRVYVAKKEMDSALVYFKKGLSESAKHGYFRGVVASNLALADVFKQSGHSDSSLYYIRSGLPVAYFLNAPDLLLRSYTALADFYKRNGNNDSTVKYQSLIIKINDSLFNSKQVQQFQNIDFDARQSQQEAEAAEKQFRNRQLRNIMLGGLITILLVALLLWRNIRQRKKSNNILQLQKKELETALSELKTTQKQLIQSEKMASLGELTAGIAHEIQNPLNFVNNFSELNTELIVEMNEEIGKGNFAEAATIAKTIEENEQKIVSHGKRADAIVKGMLQHSRSSSGVKEPTDINALADEYLRLAYHGLRAKDKSFNATMKTDFDESIGSINIIPQDIGRVILNLITNAFYAAPLPLPAGGGFKDPDYKHNPTVWVSTKRINTPSGDGGVLISVRDNGPGIPQKILDKIFQPFFTTKPTGQGTGLGLSLSYDIIKAHGGELKVETKEGEGSTFIIQLPIV